MILLIVDDIPIVVEGMRVSIPWDKLGFSEIYTAHNASEARKILQQVNVDVMLCDIQMPGESGIDLFRWTCDQKMNIRTIFLTSHAEFDYVRQVLKLGGFDYIIQPASYSEIYDSVKKAVDDIKDFDRKEKKEMIGEVFFREEGTIISNCVRNILLDNPNWTNFNILAERGLAPGKEEEVYLILLKVKQSSTVKNLEAGLFHMSIQNILKELMEEYTSIAVVANIEPDVYAVILPHKSLPMDKLEMQFYIFIEVCREYFKCSMTAYLSIAASVSEINKTWEQLREVSANDIICRPGLFKLEKVRKDSSHIYRMPEISQWANLLREGYPETMYESACALLDKMVEEEKMNAKTLMMFQLDFMEMIKTVDELNSYVIDIMNDVDNSKLYRDSSRSVENMKQFIKLISLGVKKAQEEGSPKIIVERIIQYINENFNERLMREDIAEIVHLSPDYMAKLFKNETGITIGDYIIQQKMQMAKKLLQTTNIPISFIASKIGYCNFSHFSYTYKKIMGVTPQSERKTYEQVNR